MGTQCGNKGWCPMKLTVSTLCIVILLPATLRALTLGELQNAALADNPRLRAMTEEAKMSKIRVVPESSLENPRLKLGLNNLMVDDPSLSGDPMTSLEVGVSQMLTLWGKLSIRERIALKKHQSAVENLRRERIDLLHRLRNAVYELDYLDGYRNILGEIRKQIKLVIESEVTASKAGRGSLSGVIKANVEYAMIDEELLNLDQRVREDWTSLRYLLGKEGDIGDISLTEPVFEVPDADTAKKRIAASNPDIAAARIAADIAESEVSLRKREYLPDVELGFSYMYRKDTPDMRRSDMVSGMATMQVPAWFWKRNAPMVDEMKSKGAAMKDLERDRTNGLFARADVVLGRMQRSKDLYLLYDNTIIPQTELAIETALARYRTGSVEFMPVIDGVRMLLRYRKERIMAVKEYRAANSELHALMGGEVLP